MWPIAMPGLWVGIFGAIVLIFALIARYRIESIPADATRLLTWIGAVLLVLGLLVYLIVPSP